MFRYVVSELKFAEEELHLLHEVLVCAAGSLQPNEFATNDGLVGIGG